MTTKQLLGLVALGLTLSLGACAPADPPVNPSFATDVLPVMKAHCVRCHGANGMLNADPGVTSTLALYRMAPTNGYFDTYEDKPGCVPTMTTYCGGAKTEAALIKAYIHFGNDMRMPPLPSDPLSDWDIKLLDNWTSKTPPNP